MVVYSNAEGCEHGLLHFHALTKVALYLKVLVTIGLKIGFKRKRIFLTQRRSLVNGFGFEKMRVATLNVIFSVTNSNCLAQ